MISTNFTQLPGPAGVRPGMEGMVGKPLGIGGRETFGMEGIVGRVGIAPALGSGGSPPPDGRVGKAPALGSGGNPPVGRVGSGRDGMVGIGGSAVGFGSWRSCRAAIPFFMLENVTAARTIATRKNFELEAMFMEEVNLELRVVLSV
ncbi:unnamed protein product [Linum tenue]|uniref:Uncharacterized protein n=1 Tax=Linum tenue TaxID=586396 RepID=A0AAV0NNM1_9ROSI|nr:unnamed protein product [Linum tenue]